MTTFPIVGRVTPPSFRVKERIVEFVCGEGMNRVGRKRKRNISHAAPAVYRAFQSLNISGAGARCRVRNLVNCDPILISDGTSELIIWDLDSNQLKQKNYEKRAELY